MVHDKEKIAELLKKSKYSDKSMKDFVEDEKYNPWLTDEAVEVVNEFIKGIENFNSKAEKNSASEIEMKRFSWLNIEKEFKEKEYASSKKFPSNIHYALPTHIQGDVEKSYFFLCLTNPNINRDDIKNESFVEYFNNFKIENNKDTTFNFKDFISYDGNKIKSIKDYCFKSIYKKIIADENPLVREWKSFSENENENIADYYYLKNYYHKLLESKVKGEGSIDKKYKNISEKFQIYKNRCKEEIDNIIENSLICNLECYPFRSKNPNYSKNGGNTGNLILDNETNIALFSPRIILHKIGNYLNNQGIEKKPVFIFRRFENLWEKNIKKVLKKDYSLEQNEIGEIMNYLLINHFYFLGGKSQIRAKGLVSENNVKKIDEEKGEEVKIDKEELWKLSNIAFPE